MDKNCCCNIKKNDELIIGEYICYFSHVTEKDIIDAIKSGASTIQQVIKVTGAMESSNCEANNPKGTCCYSDILYVFNKYI